MTGRVVRWIAGSPGWSPPRQCFSHSDGRARHSLGARPYPGRSGRQFRLMTARSGCCGRVLPAKGSIVRRCAPNSPPGAGARLPASPIGSTGRAAPARRRGAAGARRATRGQRASRHSRHPAGGDRGVAARRDGARRSPPTRRAAPPTTCCTWRRRPARLSGCRRDDRGARHLFLRGDRQRPEHLGLQRPGHRLKPGLAGLGRARRLLRFTGHCMAAPRARPSTCSTRRRRAAISRPGPSGSWPRASADGVRPPRLSSRRPRAALLRRRSNGSAAPRPGLSAGSLSRPEVEAPSGRRSPG